jgi:hypothetical protein
MWFNSWERVSRTADHTRGGILVAWREAVWAASAPVLHCFSVSVKIRPVATNDEWWLIAVYEPSRDAEKDEFLTELRGLAQAHQGPLLVGGESTTWCIKRKTRTKVG